MRIPVSTRCSPAPRVRPRIIAALIVLAGVCLAFPAVAEGELKKRDPTATEIHEIRVCLESERWVLRSLAAIESRQFRKLGTAMALGEACVKEKHRLVKAFLHDALATWPSEEILAAVPEEAVSMLLLELDDAGRTQFEVDASVAFLTALFNEKLGYDMPAWMRLLRKAKLDYAERHAAARRAVRERENRVVYGPPPPPAVGSREALIPKDLESTVARLENDGVEIAILLDDTGSMGGVIRDAQESITYLMQSIGLLAKEYRVGVVTYKDAVNLKLPLTSNMKAAQAFIDKVSASGGGDFEEASDKAFEFAIHQFSWKREPARLLILVGDAPCHDKDFPDFLAGVKKAAGQGFKLYAMCANKNKVKGFEALAAAGNGAMVTLSGPGSLMAETLKAVFGSDKSQAIAYFCDRLPDCQKPYIPR